VCFEKANTVAFAFFFFSVGAKTTQKFFFFSFIAQKKSVMSKREVYKQALKQNTTQSFFFFFYFFEIYRKMFIRDNRRHIVIEKVCSKKQKKFEKLKKQGMCSNKKIRTRIKFNGKLITLALQLFVSAKKKFRNIFVGKKFFATTKSNAKLLP
jgi:hypothetical protein